MLPKHPLYLYYKIVTDEFLRELEHLLAVASGRAQAKADFTDKLLSVLKARAGEALGSLPGGDWLVSALEYALDWGNALRKQKKSAHAERQGHQIEMLHLRIVIETVAMEAARRHQFFISEYLDADAVAGLIPFAKTGVERMLEHVLRRKLNLHEAHLLMGMMHGRSGRYVSGYTNTELKVKPEIGKKGKRHTAEGAYSRSAYVDTAGQLYQVAKRTNLLDKTEDAKYGYVHLPQATLDGVGATIQSKESLGAALKERLEKYQPSWVTITKADIAEYLKTIDPKKANNPSLLAYLEEKHQHPIERFFYVGDTPDDWDLTAFSFAGADLSNGVFNHCVFAGSLNHTQFNNAYLRQADFSRVESAHEASFKNAHMEFINAEGINFTNSDLIQAHCEYGNFKNANLEQCQTLGTQWLYAELDGIKLDGPAVLETIERAQADQLKRLEVQERATEALNERLSAQQVQIEQLQNHLRELAQTIAEQASESTTEESDSDTESDQEDALVALQALNEKLLQEQQARLAFERYCESTLQTLTQESETSKQTQALQAAEIEQLKATLSALQSQDETFQTLINKLGAQLSETSSRVKANTLDIEAIRSHIETMSTEINEAVEKQAKDLAALTERVDKVEAEQVRTDVRLHQHHERLGHLEATLGAQAVVELQETTEKVKQTIKRRYGEDNKIQGVFGKPLLMSKESGGYVNLQIVLNSRVEKEKKGASKPIVVKKVSLRDERLNSFEDLFGKKRLLMLRQLFEPADVVFDQQEKESLRLDGEDFNKPPRLLFVQGRAGIGKTTFVRYSTYQWTQGELWPKFEWVFALTFRELRGQNFMAAEHGGQQYALWQWVYFHYGFAAQDISEAEFRVFWQQVIEKNRSKVLFMFDGFDEAPDKHPCKAAFEHLLQPKTDADCTIMITSRPVNSDVLPHNKRNLEIVGLTNENIKNYTRNYFGESAKAAALVKCLELQPTLWGMAHIPMTLNSFCGLYDSQPEIFKNLRSMSQIYQAMLVQILILSAKREAEALKMRSEKSIEDILSKQQQENYVSERYQLHCEVLSRLALKGLEVQQILLPESWLDQLIEEAIVGRELKSTEGRHLRRLY